MLYPIFMKKLFPTSFELMRLGFCESYYALGDEFRETILTRFKSIAKLFRSGPYTLCHGDMKMDNLIFKKPHKDPPENETEEEKEIRLDEERGELGRVGIP